jgi:hypothetical protein
MSFIFAQTFLVLGIHFDHNDFFVCLPDAARLIGWLEENFGVALSLLKDVLRLRLHDGLGFDNEVGAHFLNFLNQK